jgi:hypothetical protein
MKHRVQTRAGERGQVMAEYAYVLAMFAGVALILLFLLSIFTEYSWRLVSLVGLEYP